MIKSFRHKGLQRYFEKGAKAGIQAANATRLRLMLSRLDDASGPGDMDAPGWRLHGLKGKLRSHRAIWLDGKSRLTFMFEGKDAILVDYQDNH